MKRIVTWILVADGDQAKLFENDGPGKGLRAIEGLQFEQEHLRAREIMADRPGRAGAGTAPGSRAAMEYHSDPVDVRERRFLDGVAELLNAKCLEGTYDRLVVAAAPAALGELRAALSEQVKKTMLTELPKDLTNIPTAKLSEHFDSLLAV